MAKVYIMTMCNVCEHTTALLAIIVVKSEHQIVVVSASRMTHLAQRDLLSLSVGNLCFVISQSVSVCYVFGSVPRKI